MNGLCKSHTHFMLLIAGLDLSTGVFALLVLCILAVCFFEFVNGFHDTANAVATVIYTHSMKPNQAVVLSGLLNFSGVLLGGLGVAWGILKLLPLTELMHAELGTNIAFMLAVLIAAISWNLGTWYLGLPASSSHTLIGALVGASWMFSALSPDQTQKAYQIFLFLFISPLIGFVASLLLLSFMRKTIKSKDLYSKPKDGNPPPMWIRILIILGCVGVSFNHGSNDGQKGVGLLMVVLIAFLPSYFALTPDFDAKACSDSLVQLQKMVQYTPKAGDVNPLQYELSKLNADIQKTQDLLNAAAVADLPKEKKGRSAPTNSQYHSRRGQSLSPKSRARRNHHQNHLLFCRATQSHAHTRQKLYQLYRLRPHLDNNSHLPLSRSRHDDWLETHRRNHRRKNRQIWLRLLARLCFANRFDHHHRYEYAPQIARFDHAHCFFVYHGDNVCQRRTQKHTTQNHR
jgi:phosphate/sulfate permease